MFLFIFCNISGIVTAVIRFVPASFILPALNHMLNGRGYPIHPLDLSQVEFDVDDNGNNFTACRATIVDLGAGSANDAVFGDSFMRNEYSVYVLSHLFLLSRLLKSIPFHSYLLFPTASNLAIMWQSHPPERHQFSSSPFLTPVWRPRTSRMHVWYGSPAYHPRRTLII